MNESQNEVKNVNRQFIIETNSDTPNDFIELFLNQMLPGDYKIKSNTVPRVVNMDNQKETIKEKLECAFSDMDAHSYNDYTDDSEYIVTFTVAELKWLYEELGGTIYY